MLRQVEIGGVARLEGGVDIVHLEPHFLDLLEEISQRELRCEVRVLIVCYDFRSTWRGGFRGGGRGGGTTRNVRLAEGLGGITAYWRMVEEGVWSNMRERGISQRKLSSTRPAGSSSRQQWQQKRVG